MNKPSDNRDRLVAELFHAGWTEGPGAEFARQAAATARRHRAARRTAMLGGTLAAAAVAFVVAHFAERPAGPVSASRRPAYQEISDDELLAALRDRPVLVLPDGQGGRKIVLLDQ
jgi:hypothetical protein